MAQLGKLEITVTDANGNKLTGVSVEVRKQGAQVKGAQSGSPVTVDAPGALAVNDSIRKNTEVSPTRGVISVSATQIGCGTGFLTLSDDDRLTTISPLPTIYEDSFGTTTTSNPLTTDSKGYAQCYAVGGVYDVLISGGGADTRLIVDVLCGGGETVRTNVYFTGAQTAWKFDTLRTATVTDKLIDISNAGAPKFSVAGDGEIAAGTSGATHSLVGSLTASEGVHVTAGGVTIDAGGLNVMAGGAAVQAGDVVLSGSPGRFIQSGTGTNNFNGSLATVLDVTGRRLVAGSPNHVTGTDWVLSGGFGATTSKSCSSSASDAHGELLIGPTSGGGYGANPTATLTFKDGAWGGGAHAFTVRGSGGNQLTIPFTVSSISTTQLVLTFVGTVGGGESYEVYWLVIG